MISAPTPDALAFADFTLPGGCLLCGSDLQVRMTPGNGAHSYCQTCHWLSKPVVQVKGQGLTVSYNSAAQA